VGRPDQQTAAELREQYEVERELAGRLRAARSKEDRRRLYGEVYLEISERIPHHGLVRQAADAATQAEAVEPQVALLRPFLDGESRFCDVGAGDGAVAREVAGSVKHSLALDVTDALALPSDEAVGYQFRVFDGFDLGLPDDSLDVAYSNQVAEHLHPDDMLDQTRSICRALRPGGVYICVTPNRLSGPHDISKFFADTPQGFHLREYTVTELATAFRQAGFSRIKVVLTMHGRRLSPLLPAGVLRPVEALLEVLPRRLRRALGRGLVAAKVVAIK
jgi:SAM-dependent methyltransferase